MKNIIENNKLIAEFMECIINGNDFIFPKEMYYLYQPCFMYEFESGVYNFELDISEVKFNKSWDWLMPVVEKIESLDFIFEILSTRVDIADYRVIAFKKRFEPIIKETKIEAVYTACVEFIKWYNEQK